MPTCRSLICSATLGLLALSSCRALLYPILATAPKPTRKVLAEFSKLPGHRVLILVWADQATLFDYPNIRYELAEYVAYHLKDKLKNLTIVPNREVARYQQTNYHWDSQPPALIGRKFDAELVLHIELLQYTTRAAGTPHLLCGQGRAAITIYDCQAEPPRQRLYHGQAEARYPPSGSLGLLQADDASVHARTLDLLGAAIAAKFYDHEVEL